MGGPHDGSAHRMVETERTTVGTLRRCVVVLAALALPTAFPAPAEAVTELHSPGVSPNPGTTATIFTITVGYRSQPEARPALAVTVEVVGLSGPQAMTRVSGSATDGTWRLRRMLPAGSWDLVFRADAQGSDPAPLDGPTVVVNPAATPFPTASPIPTATPTATPGRTASPRPTPRPTPRATPRATPRPTPRPPGVTPAPTSVAPTPGPGSTATPAGSAGPSTSRSAGAPPSDGPSSEPAASASAPGSGSTDPAPSASVRLHPDARDESGWGFGQLALIAIGGLVSATGALVIARGWWRLRH